MSKEVLKRAIHEGLKNMRYYTYKSPFSLEKRLAAIKQEERYLQGFICALMYAHIITSEEFFKYSDWILKQALKYNSYSIDSYYHI